MLIEGSKLSVGANVTLNNISVLALHGPIQGVHLPSPNLMDNLGKQIDRPWNFRNNIFFVPLFVLVFQELLKQDIIICQNI